MQQQVTFQQDATRDCGSVTITPEVTAPDLSIVGCFPNTAINAALNETVTFGMTVENHTFALVECDYVWYLADPTGLQFEVARVSGVQIPGAGTTSPTRNETVDVVLSSDLVATETTYDMVTQVENAVAL